MKSLFNTLDSEEIIERINILTPDTKAQWGKMNVSQMLAHSLTPFKIAFGEMKLKRGLMGIVFGGIAKKKLINEEPFKKNLPTDKKFVVADQRNFEEEKKNLIAILQKFGQIKQEELTKEPHPFFGNLTAKEWDTLMWKHIDHHLRQFGV